MNDRARFAALKAHFEQGPGAAARVSLEERFPSMLPLLDRLLDGGFPRGALVTLEGAYSSGRWSIAARLLACATQRGLAAVLDDGALYPPDLVRAGVRLDRLLVVPAKMPLLLARAADALVRSRIARVIVMPALSLRAAIWTRLARLAQRAGVLLLAIVPWRASADLAGAARLRLTCTFDRVSFHGTRGVWCRFTGFAVRAEVRHHVTTLPAVANAAG